MLRKSRRERDGRAPSFGGHPNRVCAVIAIISELARHAHISIHLAKTQLWNRGGIAPEGIEELTRLARLVKPEAVVWRSDANLHDQQGCAHSGSALGSAGSFRRQSEEKPAQEVCAFWKCPRLCGFLSSAVGREASAGGVRILEAPSALRVPFVGSRKRSQRRRRCSTGFP